jgi:hypothetical protein
MIDFPISSFPLQWSRGFTTASLYRQLCFYIPNTNGGMRIEKKEGTDFLILVVRKTIYVRAGGKIPRSLYLERGANTGH